MRYIAPLLLLLFFMACHLKAQTTISNTAQLRCLSYEEPSCSACFQQDTESCEALVTFYQDGREIQHNLSRAAYFWGQAQPLFEERCAQGEFAACEKVGLSAWDGLLMRRDLEKARRYFQAGELLSRARCDKGEVGGCLDLAGLYQHEGYANPRGESEAYQCALRLGEGAAYVLVRALWLRYNKDEQSLSAPERPTESPVFTQSCQDGALPRCVTLGIFYQDTDPKKAEAILQDACQRGSGEACFRVAPLDPAAWQRSCALGFREGCRTLLANKVSPGALQESWEKSCLQGDILSCEALLQASPNEPQEKAKERLSELYEEGCSAGIGRSCYRWFRMEKKARGLYAPEARTKTREVLESGCAAGDASDCFYLGTFLIPKESALAIETIERSCDLGSMQACQQLSSGAAWRAEPAKQQEKLKYYTCRAQELHPFMPAPSPCIRPAP